MALSFALFFIPSQIAPGGFSGIATVLHHLFGTPVGTMNFILCIPLFLMLITKKTLGILIKSVYGTALFSVFTDLTAAHFNALVSDDLFLTSVFGGILLGLGLGIVYRFGGSTGGSDLLAVILQRKIRTGLSVGNLLTIIDITVVACAAFVFASIPLALYAVISIYVSMQMIDLIVEGMNRVKGFYIFSNERELIKTAILEHLNRGVTVFHAEGGYSGEKRDVLFCVVGRSQIGELKSIISAVDPNAFVILVSVSEVFGEGFKQEI
jgi:uncharacterized membrane-anchored protein YitT (DUF2179 family)